MATPFGMRVKNAWNAFLSREPTETVIKTTEYGYSYRPDRKRMTRGNERTIVTSIYNRIAMDVSSIDIRHVRLDETGRFIANEDSYMNDCLTTSSNVDQTARAFMQDVVMSMLDEGHVVIVPTDVKRKTRYSQIEDIYTMRTGKVVEWYPTKVKVNVYNEQNGRRQDILLSKADVAIIENPFYAVVNEPNSTMARLIRKLNLLDSIDEQSGSGKLDLIIQLPYVIKSDARRKQAEDRRKDIENQLAGSKFGIAYTDGTEKITQLNRPLENNLMKQIEYLTDMVYSQLGITKEIMDGSANEQAMQNYYSRTIEPIVSAISDEMKRKFLSTTARSQGQSIMFFRDPFKLVPVEKLADMADKFTRNEIMSSNEIRSAIGLVASSDPSADELRNKNISQPNDNGEEETYQEGYVDDGQYDYQNGYE